MTVTVVVVAFHKPESLARLLAELRGVRVIVVNVDDDPAVRAVAADATVLPLHGNPGYAAAVNAGAAAATTEAIVFMNDDVSIAASSIHALADALDGADVVVPALRDADGAPELTIAALPTPSRIAVEWALLPDAPLAHATRVQKWRTPDSVERVDAAAATVVAVRASLLADEPLPEAYFLYWEESEWFWRLRRRGARVVYRPDITAQHSGGRADVRPEKSRLLARNAVLCVRRTQGRVAAAVTVPIVIAWNLRLLVVAAVRRRHVRARWAGLRAAVGSWAVVR